MKLTTTQIMIALTVVLGLSPLNAEPVRLDDIRSDSPWVAHIDTEKLRASPLGDFFTKTAGFDRVLQLKASLKEKLSLDIESVSGVTLLASGPQWKETSILLRGDFKGVDLTSFPLAQSLPGGREIRKGPSWKDGQLFLSKFSEKKLVLGSSKQAVDEGLQTFEAPVKRSWASEDLTDGIRKKMVSATSLFAIDMGRIGGELKFEAEFTRAAKSAWFLVGTRGDEIEASLVINSADEAGLAFLGEQWNLFSAMLLAGEEVSLPVRESVAAQKVETEGNWMTITMTASPEKVAQFLKSTGTLFAEKAPKK